MRIALLLANGFEEIEALTPLDVLRRAGVLVDTIGIGAKTVVGAHNIPVVADITDAEANANDYDGVIFPGGMPGSTNLDAAEFTDKIIAAVTNKGGRLAAICAAPLVLGRRGLLKGKKATCYPGFENELTGAEISSLAVVTDGNITTAKGMGVALEFAKELTSLWVCPEVSEEISRSIMENTSKDRISFDLSVDEFKTMFDLFDDEDSDELDELDELDGFDISDEIDDRDDFYIQKECSNVKKIEPASIDYSEYSLPPLDLLNKGKECDEEDTAIELQECGERILEVLDSFNVPATLRCVERGPRITRYSIVPARGVRVNQIQKLADDIALALAAESIRIEAPIPGKSAIGIEVPNKKPSLVTLRDLLEADEFVSDESKTCVCIGKSVEGSLVYADIGKMPHALIAGATGMGKSVCINALITSMLYKARPDEVKFIMIDPKKVEFAPYAGLPHLLIPVVTDPKQAAGALMWAVDEMNKRYDIIEQLRVKNIDSYNRKIAENPELGAPMSKIVIFIDELNDLMVQVRDPVENLIMLLAQKSRAAGIHLVIGTQRPSVDVLTGVIKANIPTRIACKVSSGIDSRTILEKTGAEKLIGKGDMLFAFPGKEPKRVQGAFVSDGETEAIVDFIKSQVKGEIYDEQALEDIKRAAQKCDKSKNGDDGFDDDDDEGSGVGYLHDRKFLNAVELAVRNGSVATSFLQRKLHIGYGKAAQYIDIMEDLGVVGEKNGSKARDVLISMDEWNEKLARLTDDY